MWVRNWLFGIDLGFRYFECFRMVLWVGFVRLSGFAIVFL